MIPKWYQNHYNVLPKWPIRYELERVRKRSEPPTFPHNASKVIPIFFKRSDSKVALQVGCLLAVASVRIVWNDTEKISMAPAQGWHAVSPPPKHESKVIPNWSQSDPKMLPKLFPNAPRDFQSGPIISPIRSQNDSKMISKSLQSDPKVTIKWPQGHR